MHPPRTRAASRLSWIAIAGLWGNAIYWAIRMIERSGLPQTYDGYRYRHGNAPADWAFPTADVATWIGAMVVEALVVSVLLRLVQGSIAGICLVCGALYGLAAFVMIPLAMHAPTTFSIHAISLLFATAWLIVMMICAAAAMTASRASSPAGLST